MVFPLTLDQFMCCVSHHNNWCKQFLFPDFHSIYYFPLTQANNLWDYKQFACLLFNKKIIRFLSFFVQQKISKRCRLKNWVCFAQSHNFWKTKCKSSRAIMEQWFSRQNKSVCQKTAWSCKKWKSAQKRYTTFLHKTLQLSLYYDT